MARLAALIFGLALLPGCSGAARYTETDNQRTVQADLGTIFTLSLPASGDAAAKPAYSAQLLEMGPESRDDAGRRVFEFKAKMAGETDIRVGRDFSLHVRVTSSSDRPGMHVHTR